jgi:hypothetical protein
MHEWNFTDVCCAEDEAADEPPRNAALVLLRGLAAAADTPEMATSAAPEVRRVQLVSLLCYPTFHCDPFSGFSALLLPLQCIEDSSFMPTVRRVQLVSMFLCMLSVALVPVAGPPGLDSRVELISCVHDAWGAAQLFQAKWQHLSAACGVVELCKLRHACRALLWLVSPAARAQACFQLPLLPGSRRWASWTCWAAPLMWQQGACARAPTTGPRCSTCRRLRQRCATGVCSMHAVSMCQMFGVDAPLRPSTTPVAETDSRVQQDVSKLHSLKHT